MFESSTDFNPFSFPCLPLPVRAKDEQFFSCLTNSNHKKMES